MESRFLVVLLACAAAGCRWSRFDDVGKNPPVVLLKKPAKYPSFGVSLATATKPGDSTRLLVGGSPGATPASIFELGVGTAPIIDAVDTGPCTQGDSPDINKCVLAAGVAGIGKADVGQAKRKDQCFVLGAGKAVPATEWGLIGRCADTTEYTLPVPDDVLQIVIHDEIIVQGTAATVSLHLSTDKDESAALAAGAVLSDQGFAWYYQPETTKDRTPHALVPPGKGEKDYGASVAVLRLPGADGGTRRLIAVGSPDAGHVWLFAGDARGALVGCLGGIEGLGRTLASGQVNGDAFDDLVIADAANVTVVSGEALAGLSPMSPDAVTCSLAALPPHGILASFGCGTRDSLAGCPGGFGTSLAVGDLDGDGDGEVIVGAPGLTARGKSGAGGVLVYDAEGKTPEALTDLFFLASAEENDALGASVVAAPIEDRDVLIAGASGGARTAVFYCSSVLGGAATGSRCE